MKKFYDLTSVSDYEVNKFLKDNLQLSPYQQELLVNNEIIRFSGFEIFKQKEKSKSNLLFRLTIVVFPTWLILLYFYLPINWIITNKWGFNPKTANKLIGNWAKKINL